MDGYKRFILGASRVGMLLWLVVVCGFVLAGLIDNLIGMGWGYSWSDVLTAFLILLAGSGIYLLCRWFFKIIRFGDL
jgi:hypothetical protein